MTAKEVSGQEPGGLPHQQPHVPTRVDSSLSASHTASFQELSDVTESQLETQQGRTRDLLANISWSKWHSRFLQNDLGIILKNMFVYHS